MSLIFSILPGFLFGVAGWFITAFIGSPLISFRDARSEAERVLQLYAEHDRFDPDFDPDWQGPHKERGAALSAVGAQLLAFSGAYQWLDRHPLRWLKLKPKLAGEQLMLLAQTKSHGPHNAEIRAKIKMALRLGHVFGHTRI